MSTAGACSESVAASVIQLVFNASATVPGGSVNAARTAAKSCIELIVYESLPRPRPNTATASGTLNR